MSDEDLVKRGEIKAFRRSFVWCGELVPGVTIEDIDCVPAAPHEMTAREYLETEARMCKYYGLPSAFDVSGLTVDEAISMVEKFAREHPEERSEE